MLSKFRTTAQEETTTTAEKIDASVVQASSCAEKTESKPLKPPQTKELQTARKKHDALRNILFLFRNHPNDTKNVTKHKTPF